MSAMGAGPVGAELEREPGPEAIEDSKAGLWTPPMPMPRPPLGPLPTAPGALRPPLPMPDRELGRWGGGDEPAKISWSTCVEHCVREGSAGENTWHLGDHAAGKTSANHAQGQGKLDNMFFFHTQHMFT